jgi:hypothetical protein
MDEEFRVAQREAERASVRSYEDGGYPYDIIETYVNTMKRYGFEMRKDGEHF